ncbi:MAG: phosphate ABC transporter substrate-binding protein PstS [Trebonia sp.]
MPYLLPRTQTGKPPRTAAALTAAAVLAITAALTACTSAAGTPSTLQASAAGTSTVRLTGAGSTFDAPFFTKAFAAYQQSRPGVTVSYASVGSSAGITRFTAGTVNFGATDVPASSTDLAAARGGPAVQVPVDLGGISVAYNVMTLNGSLKLTGPVLARIFLGQITRWNDPAITALNPGAELPDTYITVVHRADGSGTTYIFSDYLSHVSPAWATKVGAGRSLHWPVGYGADGNQGVASTILRIPGSIGYAEDSYTAGTAINSAAIANHDGNYVTPSPATITADAAAKPAITAEDFSIVNEPGADAYPISGYSWVLVSASQPSETAGRALAALITWLTHAGQSYAATLGYVPLPAQIQQLATTTLARVTGPDGQSLTS